MNPELYLVDSSAWIEGFRGKIPADAQSLLRTIVTGGSCATCPVIILELLQGCLSVQERDALQMELESLVLFPIDQQIWNRCYTMGSMLKRKGLTIPTVDIIVAATALENDCSVIHCDKHFELIAAQTELKAKKLGG